jgi:nitroreductase
MVRSFASTPLDPGVVDRILLAALRSPTAGNSGGTAWVVLEGPEQTAVYFDTATDETWRAAYREWYEGLRRAPVLLLAYASPQVYVSRYAEPDKEGAGLGESSDDWLMPYWYGDAAMGVMTALLGAVDAGLGACILGTFRGEDELSDCLGVPEGWRLYCAVPLGHPDGNDRRSPSLRRTLPAREERIHRGHW